MLILDEPTSGLDPLMEEVFEECIREVKRDGRTVLLSSHILAEVEALCDRITIIRSGRTVESGTLTDLRHVTRTSVTAHTRRAVDLTNVAGVTRLIPDGNHVTFEVDNAHLDEAIGALGDGTLASLTCSPPTLEELFLRHYETTADDAAAAANAGTS